MTHCRSYPLRNSRFSIPQDQRGLGSISGNFGTDPPFLLSPVKYSAGICGGVLSPLSSFVLPTATVKGVHRGTVCVCECICVFVCVCLSQCLIVLCVLRVPGLIRRAVRTIPSKAVFTRVDREQTVH